MTRHPSRVRSGIFRRTFRARGFNLVEMLAVLAILALLAALIFPAVQGLAGIASRNGATSMVMNALEEARVAALESGNEVYVVFSRQIAPEEDRILILRETDSGTGSYHQMNKWIKLPKGVLFLDPANGPSTILGAGVGSFDPNRSPVALPDEVALPTGKALGILKFNSRGQITFPATGKLWLHLADGKRDASGKEVGNRGKPLPMETIVLTKLTGRAQLNKGVMPSN